MFPVFGGIDVLSRLGGCSAVLGGSIEIEGSKIGETRLGRPLLFSIAVNCVKLRTIQ